MALPNPCWTQLLPILAVSTISDLLVVLSNNSPPPPLLSNRASLDGIIGMQVAQLVNETPMVITNFKFTRKLVTNDTKADHPITAGSMK